MYSVLLGPIPSYCCNRAIRRRFSVLQSLGERYSLSCWGHDVGNDHLTPGGVLLSEVSSETFRKAATSHHIGVIEADASLWSTDIFHNGIAETCKEVGTIVLAYSPLGRGMLAGNFQTHDDVANGEFHSYVP